MGLSTLVSDLTAASVSVLENLIIPQGMPFSSRPWLGDLNMRFSHSLTVHHASAHASISTAKWQENI